jgi:uncharacterized protein YecE (DUF72 family)
MGTYYPAGTRAKDQFKLYQNDFNTVEINNSFYRLPTPETFKQWRADSHPDFVFVVKASRFITHMKKLTDPKTSSEKFFANVKYLKEKLGPILFQLPPGWKKNPSRLADFIEYLPRQYKYVFEFRNSTWYDDEVYEILKKGNCAFCMYELAGHRSPAVVTANFIYVRLHGPGEKYQGSYDDSTLAGWAQQCREWQQEGYDVFVYFDNDENGYAAFNARTLKNLLG